MVDGRRPVALAEPCRRFRHNAAIAGGMNTMFGTESTKEEQGAESVRPGSNRILGAGEMADLIRDQDWGATPIGPIESWSSELVSIVNLTLNSPLPARTLWGPDLVLLYNDAYRHIPGKRHPE